MSVNEDLKNGVIYNSIGKYSNVVITFLIQIVLARVLTPSEFGVVAIINVFLVFFQLLADFGIGPAIIQSKDLNKFEIDNIFSFSVYFSLFLSFAFSLLSSPLSNFYQNALLMRAVPIMSIALFFNGLIMVPQNQLLKQKQFKNVNIVQIIGSITNGVISILFAFLGYSYFALIFGNIARSLLQFVLYFFYSDLSFYFKFSINPLKKIYLFSRNQLLFNIINYFSRNLDNILIGRYLPAEQLGYYDKSYQLSLYPNTIFTSVITSAIQPIFSNYQNDASQLLKGYLGIAKILANFGIPLSVFLYFSSNEIIAFLYGSQWEQSALAFQILSISIWIQMLQSSTGGFFQSANRTDLLLVSGFLSTIINIFGIIIGVKIGSIYWVAIMIVLTFTINFFQTNFLLLNKVFNTSIIEFYKVLIKPLIIGLMEVVSYLILPDLNFNTFINLSIKGILFVTILTIGLIVTNQTKEILRLVKGR